MCGSNFYGSDVILTSTNPFQVHSSLKVVGAGKTFATPGKPKPATPGSRRALKEKNETFVRGMTKASIASVDGNIFNAADIASSTMKADQIVSTIITGIIAFCNFNVQIMSFRQGVE